MSWLILELLSFILIILTVVMVFHPPVSVLKAEEEIGDNDEDPISHSQFLKLLDFYAFTTYEQVILCLHYLGHRKVDVSLRRLYEEIDHSMNSRDVFCMDVCIEALLATPTSSFYYVLDEVERALTDGSFTNTLDVVDDIIQAALPNYVMRFEDPRY